MPLYNKLYLLFFFLVFLFINLIPKKNTKLSRLFLLLVNLAFYGYANLKFIPILLGVGVVTFFSGIVVNGAREKRKLWAFAFCFIELLPILAIRALTFGGISLVVPLGISFFTLQAVTYTYGVYKKDLEAERDLITILTFVSFFPSVSSGPIQRAGDLIPQLKAERADFDYDKAADGFKLIAWGLFKKLVIADNLAVYIQGVRGAEDFQYGTAALFAAIMYSFQLYLDFSGYSDIAIGSARAMGFDLKKNFDHPYLSKSVGEFWRRWHISLSSWLRDYVYIPLGGSRKGEFNRYRNLLITFAVSGLWHGAGITWIVWGLYHGVCLCIENLLKKHTGYKKTGIIITFLLVTFGWIIFSAGSLSEVGAVLLSFGRIPGEIVNSLPQLVAEKGTVPAAISALLMLPKGYNIPVSLMALIIYLFISVKTYKTEGLMVIREQKSFVRWTLYFALSLCILFFSAANSGEFIYNRF